MWELKRGIGGRVDGDAFTLQRRGGPRLRRRNRMLHVCGAVDLRVGFQGRHAVIWSGADDRLLWASASGGRLSAPVSHRDAAVICVLVVNGIEQSTSLWRWLQGL